MEPLKGHIPTARCTEEEEQIVRQAAEKKGLKITDWIRRRLVRDAKQEIKQK